MKHKSLHLCAHSKLKILKEGSSLAKLLASSSLDKNICHVIFRVSLIGRAGLGGCAAFILRTIHLPQATTTCSKLF